MLRALSLALVLLFPLALAAETTREQVVTGELLVGTGVLTTNQALVFLVGGHEHPTPDGAYVRLDQAAAGGEPITLSWTSPHLAQLAISFYEDGWRSNGSCVQGAEAERSGALACVAPAGTDALAIDFLVGAQATYELRYTYPADG